MQRIGKQTFHAMYRKPYPIYPTNFLHIRNSKFLSIVNTVVSGCYILSWRTMSTDTPDANFATTILRQCMCAYNTYHYAL